MKPIPYFTLFLFLFNLNSVLIGQENLSTESETHIFWQPDRDLTEKDFEGDKAPNPTYASYCEKFDLCTVAYVGLFAILDTPKKKRDRKTGRLREKAYFAPAFEKSTSYILTQDSLGVAKQQVVFDIMELAARKAREQMKRFQDTVKGFGTATIWFKTIESDANKMQGDMIQSFTDEVFIYKKEGAYQKWRDAVDALLKKTEKFATQPKDGHRFISDRPIDPNYMVAKTVIGVWD